MDQDWGRRIVIDRSIDRTVSDVIQLMGREGFELVTQLDVRGRLQERLGKDLRRYFILEFSNPELTLTALRQDLDVGAVLPTNVAIYELADQETAVAVEEPLAGLDFDRIWRRERPDLAAVAIEMEDRLARVLDALPRLSQPPAVPGPQTGV